MKLLITLDIDGRSVEATFKNGVDAIRFISMMSGFDTHDIQHEFEFTGSFDTPECTYKEVK